MHGTGIRVPRIEWNLLSGTGLRSFSSESRAQTAVVKRMEDMKQGTKPGGKVAPRSTLAIAGKRRPPKIEKLKGDEQPPPDAPRQHVTK